MLCMPLVLAPKTSENPGHIRHTLGVRGLVFATGLFMFAGEAAQGATLQVSPEGPITTIGGAAKLAKDGDIVEIAAGDYRGDTAVWMQRNLIIRAVGGRARLIADGKSAEGKAIWVVRSEGAVTVQNIDFLQAKVPHKNGAGIRLDAGQLTVLACRFLNNENGILTSNDAKATLRIENSEFAHNGDGTGSTHNIYVGSIARLDVRGSYSHHANVGHLLKSRAAVNVIRYNRLTDEIGGKASYELEFPNGGLAIVVGNVIEQSSTTDNTSIISYGAEGVKYAGSALYLSHNTIADDRSPAGRYLDLRGNAPVFAYNNVLLGDGKWPLPDSEQSKGNLAAKWEDVNLAIRQDYRPARKSDLLNEAVPITVPPIKVDSLGTEHISLSPDAEYLFPMGTRALKQPARHAGAFQTR